MYKIFVFYFSIIVVLFTTGCLTSSDKISLALGNNPTPNIVYDESVPKSRQSLIILPNTDYADYGNVRITEFDGKSIDWRQELLGNYYVSIPAGTHTLGITFRRALPPATDKNELGDVAYVETFESQYVTFEFLPMKAYNLKAIIKYGKVIFGELDHFEFQETIVYNITINVTDKLPGGLWSFFLVKDDLATATFDTKAFLAMRNYVAMGDSAHSGRNRVKLTNVVAPGGSFDGFGTYTALFMEMTSAGISKFKYLDGVKFNDAVTTMSFGSMREIAENIQITGDQTELEGIWKNINRNQSVYTFRGDTFKMETPDGKSGNGGTFSVTDSLIVLTVSYTIVNNLSVETPSKTVEMHYSFEDSNLIMWNEGLPNQKWIYKKQ
jgi:hypothetical protein